MSLSVSLRPAFGKMRTADLGDRTEGKIGGAVVEVHPRVGLIRVRVRVRVSG